MRRLCTLCARGGSKGVPDKNIRLLAGKPLLAHSLEQALASGLFDKIAVSSDSDEILGVAKKWGAHLLVKRPAELSTDRAPKLPAIQHCAREAEKAYGAFETFVDLDATSPLRSADDIRGAVRLLEEKKVSNIITGSPSRRSPYFNLVELDGSGVARLSKKSASAVARRQDAPRCFDMNASIYVWSRAGLLEGETLFNEDTLLYEMPEERSYDIDSEQDFEIVAYLIEKRKPS